MPNVSVVDGELTIELSRWERLGALRRSDVTVAMSSVRSVQRLDRARDEIHGLRLPGTSIPGVIALGRWQARKTADFVAVRGNEPGYVIELDGEGFARLVVSSEPVAELDALV